MDAYEESHPQVEKGNDGLVTIQSAKWGEFLGIMEGCDHWEMRGARGFNIEFEWDWDEWGRYIRSWSRKRDAASERVVDEESVEREMKDSTDRLSAVVDWIVDQVPKEEKEVGNKAKGSIEQEESGREERKRNDLSTKFDLEKFYIALCRKLYDEGL